MGYHLKGVHGVIELVPALLHIDSYPFYQSVGLGVFLACLATFLSSRAACKFETSWNRGHGSMITMSMFIKNVCKSIRKEHLPIMNL